jgi:5,6-dimethylbenzimidazole synthase
MSQLPDSESFSTDYDVLLRVTSSRRSVRRFLPDAVPWELVEAVLEVARHAPSAANSQPWEFVVIEDAAMRLRIARSAASLFGEGRKRDPSFEWGVSVQPFLAQAPVLIVVLGDKRMIPAYPGILRGNILLRQSLANCVYGLQLAAASLGLSSAWGTLQGGSPEHEIREMLGIPEWFTIDHIVPLGYADDETSRRAAALEPVRKRASRRRSLDRIVHRGRYDMSKARSDEEADQFLWSDTVTRVRRDT